MSGVRYEGKGAVPLRDLRTIVDFAEAIGAAPDTLGAYRSRGYLPEPTGYVANVPVWTSAQLERWLASRPGRGRRRPAK